MLLDFHLSRAPIEPDGPPPDWVGGTLAYMSPEQQEALTAVRGARRVLTRVDGRSDIYSLGLVLYEALGGPVPLLPDGETTPAEAPWPRLDRSNPRVSIGLADVIHRCLSPAPAGRYPTAAELAADLRNHLASRPLRGVRNRSLAERWRKWRRRRPHALRLAALGLAVLLAGAAVVLLAAGGMTERRAEARRTLELGERARAAGRYGESAEALRRGLALVEGLPFHRRLADDLADQLRLTHSQRRSAEARALLEEGQSRCTEGKYAEAAAALRRGLTLAQGPPALEGLAGELDGLLRLVAWARAAQELREFMDRVRLLYGAPSPPERGLADVEGRCRAFWEKRGLLLGAPRARAPDPGARRQVAEDLLDLAVLWGDLRVHRAGKSAPAEAREALAVLDEAEKLLGSSRILQQERQRHAEALGLAEVAREAGRRAAAQVPRTAWEHYALGRSLLRAGRLDEAADPLRRAVALEPRGLWPNFYEGVCAYRRDRPLEAVAAFSACVALAPDKAACYYNRALAFTRADRADRALEDLTRALELDPSLGAAALNRAALHLRAGRFDEAEADLGRALERGADPATVHYNFALLHQACGQREQALASLRRALGHSPRHRAARDLLKRLEHQP
jgi:tetratricopeptide (TPR) repeat protein